jgi:hypothetical protein
MFKHLILPWLLPIFGMFFAAGADALAGGAPEGAVIDSGAAEGAESDLGGYEGGEEHTEVTEPTEKPDLQTVKEEPEAQEFRVPVGRRMVGMVNKYPKLKEAFAAHPELQKELEPVFRRDAAYREVFPTIGEARQMREHFPNGLADVQELHNSVKEVEELDNDFYTRDREGNYPGHTKIMENMFRDDRNAAVSLFRSMPKEWARLDRDSYNEVMGRIVGATISSAGIVDFVSDLLQGAKDAKQDGLAKGLNQLLGWASGYLKEKPQPSEEEQRLARDRQNFNREKDDIDKKTAQQFNQSFVGESKKLQTGIVRSHPAVKKLLENKTITEQKKAEIIEQVRKNVESLLGKSSSFMNKLRPAYSARKMDEVMSLQKAAWSQQWLLNRMVRIVFSKEIPQLVSNNRAAVTRRAGAPQANNTRQASDKGPKPSKQIGGRWYRDGGNGAPFTTQEVLAGQHLL